MGSCWCKEKSTVVVVPGRRDSNSDSSMSEEPPDHMIQLPKNIMINQYILQMVQVVGSASQSFDDQPAPLLKLHKIAENAAGWKRVVLALINTVPLDQPLGPSTITIIFEDCPLPAVNTVEVAVVSYELCRQRALSCHDCDDNKQSERNMLVVLGCMAEKFAGLVSTRLMTQNVMEYLITFLTDQRVPDLVLQALISIEKFAKTKDNKEALQAYFSTQAQHPLIPLEQYYGSEDILWHQVGFSARWLLDNIFFVPGRDLSYVTIDMSAINAILDCKNTTDFLKVSSDGLEARCDSHTFESVRCTFQVNGGCWYYEAEILTPGVMQIGWSTKETKFSAHEGYGIGDDNFSLAYDGCRRLLWHKATPHHCDAVPPWVPGDILGCLIDVDRQEAIFALNGVRLPTCKDIFLNIKWQHLFVSPDFHQLLPNYSDGFYAAGSFMCFQGARFNFGIGHKFRYAPTDRNYTVFNDHGTLSVEDKQVIPRWLYLEKLKMQEQEVDDEAVCAICYDRRPDTIFSPCRHTGFCQECAFRITECPMCRERVWHYAVLPL